MSCSPHAALDQSLMKAMRASGSSFYWGIRFLAKQERRDMATIYLFCRLIDDIADGDRPVDCKEQALQAWRLALASPAPQQSPPTEPEGIPLTAMLHDLMARKNLVPSVLIEIVDGVLMDLNGGIVGPRDDVFSLYCHRVAGCVGLATVRVLGAQGAVVDHFALRTGDALQITNILRDLHEDADRDRLYLPRSILDRHAIPRTDPHGALAHPHIARACHDLCAQAEEAYAQAIDSFRSLPASTQRRLRPAVIMLSSYQLILTKLKSRGWSPDRLETFAKPSRLRLLVDALFAWFLGPASPQRRTR